MTPRSLRPFTTAGQAASSAVAALQAAKPILDALRPLPGQPADPELDHARALVDAALTQERPD